MYIKIVFTIIIIGFFRWIFTGPIITYEVGSGRFGDRLIFYSIAKDLSLKHNIPFYYRPFNYSDKLQLSHIDPLYTQKLFSGYKVVHIGHDLPADINYDENILYIVSYSHWDVSFEQLNHIL